jgi:glycosyltransferase involved in cell wall biosynthesis
MSLGRPIVATAVGALPSAIESGRTGILVDPCDCKAFSNALIGLARDPQRTKAMGRAARARFHDRYTVEQMVEAYAEMLRSACLGRQTVSGS